MRRGESRSEGFTLAELIVATTMISIVMAGVYTSMYGVIGAWRQGETNYELFDDARYAMGLFTRELQASPIASAPWFIGSSDELTFFTLSSPMHVEDGLGPRVMQVSYRLEGRSGREGKRLVREERLVNSALPSAADCEDAARTGRLILDRRQEFELASNVLEFKLEYYWLPPPIPLHNSEPPPWVDMIVQNQNKKCWGLPQALSITLVLEDADASPDLARRTFNHYVVFRGSTSALPREVSDIWRGTR